MCAKRERERTFQNESKMKKKENVSAKKVDKIFSMVISQCTFSEKVKDKSVAWTNGGKKSEKIRMISYFIHIHRMHTRVLIVRPRIDHDIRERQSLQVLCQLRQTRRKHNARGADGTTSSRDPDGG